MMFWAPCFFLGVGKTPVCVLAVVVGTAPFGTLCSQVPTKLGARSSHRASTKGNGILHPSPCAAVLRPSIFHHDKDLPPCQELQQHPQGHPSNTGAIQAMLVLKCDPVGTWWCCPLSVPQSQGDMGALLTAHGLTVAAEEQEPRSVGTRRRLQVISACCPSQIFV